jgi:hypothetical protein
MIGFCDFFLGSILALLVINPNHFIVIPNRSDSSSFYPNQMGFKKTPDSIAAFLTAGATTLINLGSNGRYNIITSKLI